MARGKAKSLPSKGKGKAKPVAAAKMQGKGKMPAGVPTKRGQGRVSGNGGC
jgi:hypothetical protein